MINEIHIGELIRDRMIEERRSADWLAKELGYSRSNIYKIIERGNIDVFQLLRLCRVKL